MATEAKSVVIVAGICSWIIELISALYLRSST